MIRGVAVLSLVLSSLAFAGGRSVPLPTEFYFLTPPALAPVADGVEAVPDCDEEVFYVDHWYFLRRKLHWFRTRSSAGGWALAAKGEVPKAIARLRPGSFKHWHPKADAPAPMVVIREPRRAR